MATPTKFWTVAAVWPMPFKSRNMWDHSSHLDLQSAKKTARILRKRLKAQQPGRWYSTATSIVVEPRYLF